MPATIGNLKNGGAQAKQGFVANSSFFQLFYIWIWITVNCGSSVWT